MYSDEMLDLVTQDGAQLGYALELEMPSETLRVHTGVGDLVIDENIYLGVGALGDIEAIETETDENPVSVACSLNGLDSSMVAGALESKMIGLSAEIKLLVFDSVTRRLAMAETAIIGFVTDYNVSLSDATGVVSVTISDEFQLYEMPEYKYWTDENQKYYHDGDRLCRYVAQMGARALHWGAVNDGITFNTVA